MNIDLLVQARLNSTRLPRKVVAKANGETMLWYLMQSMRRVRGIRNISILCPVDDLDEIRAAAPGFDVWVGDEDDVASRFISYCNDRQPDAFVRVCADSPLLDWRHVSHMIQMFKETQPWMLSNVDGGFPAGQHVEIMDTAAFLIKEPHIDREHVLSRMRPVLGRKYRGYGVMPARPEPPMVLDTPDDLKRIERILEMADYRPWQFPWQTLQVWA